ncbi:AAA family ATPase [candidate division WOR-3 bacterium]|uniref:AAA family ATPase n=1 Tax=candidate division WOR-3 bacterium TaxID=2052148 RepID=A0A660SIG8_UNCW3|nr:MAG: AAA family ATPase [candidate division WOR-3 bacterium]
MKLFLTGRPRCGKTTLFLRIIRKLDITPAGFYTEEIREKGMRTGFRIRTFDGRQGILATIHDVKEHKVGKYYVDLDVLERVAIPALAVDAQLYAIDEIGKMEMLSERFRNEINRLLNSDKKILATVGRNYLQILPKDGMVFEVTPAKRSEIEDRVLSLLR